MPVRLIQIGLGNCGRYWLTQILPFHRAEVTLVGLVDVDVRALQVACSDGILPSKYCFTSLEAALATVECDAVLITTTLATHIPLALIALRAGKHVLLEPPFAPSIEQAQQVIAAAQRYKRVLQINQNYRYFPAVQMVKQLLREEALGPVGMVNVDFRHNANMASPEGHRHYRLWQPLLVDMAVHHFDLMRYVLGCEPVSITCRAWNPAWSNFVDPPVATATLLFQGGIVVNYRGSWVSPGPDTAWSGEWHMECAGGELIWSSRYEDARDQLLLRPTEKSPTNPILPDMYLQSDWHASLCAFLTAISRGSALECSGEENLKTLALTLAAVEAAGHGQAVSMFGADEELYEQEPVEAGTLAIWDATSIGAPPATRTSQRRYAG